MKLMKQLASEFVGTAFLLATVVGAGILADRLDNGLVGLSVLCVAFATGGVLIALIAAFGSISAHFNPLVTLVSAARKEFPARLVPAYVLIQVLGAIAGTVLANLMFELPAAELSTTVRSGWGVWLGEFVAVFGLLGIVLGCSKNRPDLVPVSVGGYVAGAIWFTSSTCFANPAVTIGRAFTNTLTGIQPVDVPAFILWQLVAAVVACTFFGWLLKDDKDIAQLERLIRPTDNAEGVAESDLVGTAKR